MPPSDHPFAEPSIPPHLKPEETRHAISEAQGRQPEDDGAPGDEHVVGRRRPTPGLHIVATPIGNMGDITQRAIDTLAGASVVACEDTRVTGMLLKRLGISVPLLPYHEHNADAMRPRIMERLAAGEVVALVSDAGTPLVSDPGFKLVCAAREAGYAVTAAPGASAVLTALMVAGLPTDRFLFVGFLPAKAKARHDALEELRAIPVTLVIYESVHRLPESLATMAEVLGPRQAAVCRELTKLYEEVRRASLSDLAAHYAQAGSPKGEAVVVIAPPEKEAPPSHQDVEALLQSALQESSVKDAATTVARMTGLGKREVYAMALALAKGRNTGALALAKANKAEGD